MSRKEFEEIQLFKFHKRLTVLLAAVILLTLGGTIAFIVKNGVVSVTQPLATLIGVVLVPTIALFGFLMQKRIERSYEVSKEARNASREFIDASTAYLSSLIQSDFNQQIEKFQLYQSNWFQLHTVMPELFSGRFKETLHRHYDALTAIQYARNEERRGVELNEDKMKELLVEVKDSEIEMVSALAQVCTGVELEKPETEFLMKRIAEKQTAARFSRGNVAIQMGTFLTKKDALEEARGALQLSRPDEKLEK